MDVGTIVKWNENKGFGFIKPQSNGKDVFVHISNYGKSSKKPYEGLLVSYFVSSDDNGRTAAYGVHPVKGHLNNGHQPWQQISAIILNVILLSTLYFLYSSELISFYIPFFYMIVNAVTLGLYSLDKSAAQNDTWRTSEDILHVFSLLGGWGAAALAQSFFRHKSKKRSFRNIYWMTVILNCIALFVVSIALI